MGLYPTLNLTSGKMWKSFCSQLFICLTCATVCIWFACLAFFNTRPICFPTFLCGRLHTPSGQYSELSDEQKECCWHSKASGSHKNEKVLQNMIITTFCTRPQLLIGANVIVFPFKMFSDSPHLYCPFVAIGDSKVENYRGHTIQ